MVDFERPLADPAAIVTAWEAYTADEALPGRTMADLKIAGLDLTLATLSEESDVAREIYDRWMLWEKAKSTPVDALSEMTAAGLGGLIAAIETAAIPSGDEAGAE